jgi:hypothetical protein
MIASLLIATQGLMPSPSSLSIGTQGLLGVSVIPPISPRDLSGGGGKKEEKKKIFYVAGNRLTFSLGNVSVFSSSSTEIIGTSFQTKLENANVSMSSKTLIRGTRGHSHLGRADISLSATCKIVGCEEDDELELYMLGIAAFDYFDAN